MARLLLIILAVLIISPANAQPAPNNDTIRNAQRIQEREQERQRQREQQFRNDQIAPPSGNETQLQEIIEDNNGKCLPIYRVNIKGMTRFSEEDFSESINVVIGECISVTEINGLLRAITNAYIAAGNITSRAFVGPQDLNDNIIDVVVIEGQISSIESASEGYGNSTLKAAFSGLKEKILNLRDLEQGVDQLGRLPSYEPNIDIAPGILPGTSIIKVSRKKIGETIRPSVSFDNDGAENTGITQSTIGLDIDNILGIADYLSVFYTRGLTSRDGIGTDGIGAFISVPRGYWTATISAGRFSYDSILEGNGLSFATDGITYNGSISIDRLIYRDSKTKFSVNGSIGLLDIENSIQGIVLATNSYRQITGSISGQLQRRTKNGLASIGLTYKRGLDILGANSVDTGPGGPSIEFNKIAIDGSYRSQFKLLGASLNYAALFRAQTAIDSVFPAELLSVGGSSTVRGFRDDGISGRHGAFYRQQIGFPIVNLFKNKEDAASQVTGFIGHDTGFIIPSGVDEFERGTLQSATAGIRLLNKRLQGEFSLSVPFDSPAFVNRDSVVFSASLRIAF